MDPAEAIQGKLSRSFIIRILAHAVKDPKFNTYRQMWLTASTLALIICAEYKILDNLTFNGEDLNNATKTHFVKELAKAGIGDINKENFEFNCSGVYSVKSRGDEGLRHKFYYLSEEGVVYPPKRKQRISPRRSEEVVYPPKRKQRTSTRIGSGICANDNIDNYALQRPPSSSADWTKSICKKGDEIQKSLQQIPPEKRDICCNDLLKVMTTALAVAVSEKSSPTRKQQAKDYVSPTKSPDVSIYWYSTDAIHLFCPNKPPDTSVIDIINDTIDVLDNGLKTHDGCLNLVEKGLTREDVSPYEVMWFIAKIRMVKKALENALKTMGSGKKGDNWEKCCRGAVKFGKVIGGSEYPTYYKQVAIWHAEFRTHGAFLRNRARSAKTAIPLPRMLIDFPEEAQELRTFIRTNLEEMSVEKVHRYIHDIWLYEITKSFLDLPQHNGTTDWNTGDDDDVRSATKKDVLQYYKLDTLSYGTVWRWMRSLGMRYCDRKKNFYVDGHERVDVVASRHSFLTKYLRREFQMHRWIQMTKKALSELEEIHGSISGGFEFGEDMIEFHVDAHVAFMDIANSSEMGGNLSVRKPDNSKIIISFGHDEVISSVFIIIISCLSKYGRRDITIFSSSFLQVCIY